MHVRYERPMPDLSHTVCAPLLVDIAGRHGVTVERWCLDGIHPTPALAGAQGAAWLTIPFQGFGITLCVHLRPDPETGLLRFHRLGTREGRVLRHFYRSLVTGRAVRIEGMITAMDTPVEPVPMGQTEAEAKAQTRQAPPRAARAVLVVALYAALAALAWGPIVVPVAEDLRLHLAPASEVALR